MILLLYYAVSATICCATFYFKFELFHCKHILSFKQSTVLNLIVSISLVSDDETSSIASTDSASSSKNKTNHGQAAISADALAAGTAEAAAVDCQDMTAAVTKEITVAVTDKITVAVTDEVTAVVVQESTADDPIVKSHPLQLVDVGVIGETSVDKLKGDAAVSTHVRDEHSLSRQVQCGKKPDNQIRGNQVTESFHVADVVLNVLTEGRDARSADANASAAANNVIPSPSGAMSVKPAESMYVCTDEIDEETERRLLEEDIEEQEERGRLEELEEDEKLIEEELEDMREEEAVLGENRSFLSSELEDEEEDEEPVVGENTSLLSTELELDHDSENVELAAVAQLAINKNETEGTTERFQEKVESKPSPSEESLSEGAGGVNINHLEQSLLAFDREREAAMAKTSSKGVDSERATLTLPDLSSPNFSDKMKGKSTRVISTNVTKETSLPSHNYTLKTSTSAAGISDNGNNSGAETSASLSALPESPSDTAHEALLRKLSQSGVSFILPSSGNLKIKKSVGVLKESEAGGGAGNFSENNGDRKGAGNANGADQNNGGSGGGDADGDDGEKGSGDDGKKHHFGDSDEEEQEDEEEDEEDEIDEDENYSKLDEELLSSKANHSDKAEITNSSLQASVSISSISDSLLNNFGSSITKTRQLLHSPDVNSSSDASGRDGNTATMSSLNSSISISRSVSNYSGGNINGNDGNDNDASESNLKSSSSSIDLITSNPSLSVSASTKNNSANCDGSTTLSSLSSNPCISISSSSSITITQPKNSNSQIPLLSSSVTASLASAKRKSDELDDSDYDDVGEKSQKMLRFEASDAADNSSDEDSRDEPSAEGNDAEERQRKMDLQTAAIESQLGSAVSFTLRNNTSVTISDANKKSSNSSKKDASSKPKLEDDNDENILDPVMKNIDIKRVSCDEDKKTRRSSSENSSAMESSTVDSLNNIKVSNAITISSISSHTSTSKTRNDSSSSPDSGLSSSLSSLLPSISISKSNSSDMNNSNKNCVSLPSGVTVSSSVSVIKNLSDKSNSHSSERHSSSVRHGSNERHGSNDQDDTSASRLLETSMKGAKEMSSLMQLNKDMDVKPVLNEKGTIISQEVTSGSNITAGNSKEKSKSPSAGNKEGTHFPAGVDTSKLNSSISIIAVSTSSEKSRATSTTAPSRPCSGISARSTSTSPANSSSSASPAVGNISVKGSSSLLQSSQDSLVPPPPPLSQQQQHLSSAAMRNVTMLSGVTMRGGPGCGIRGGLQLPGGGVTGMRPLNCPPLRPQQPGLGVGPTNCLPPEAGPLSQQLHQCSHKLAEIMRVSLEEVLAGLIASGSPEARVAALQLELERTSWRHQQEMAEVRHNTDIMLGEMRASLEAEKHRALEEVRILHPFILSSFFLLLTNNFSRRDGTGRASVYKSNRRCDLTVERQSIIPDGTSLVKVGTRVL